MHADVALSQVLRDRVMPESHLKGEANLLVLPNLDAANIALNMTKVLGEALHVGPILDRTVQAGPRADTIGHKPRRGEHDGACQRRCAGGEASFLPRESGQSPARAWRLPAR
jgi:hypothetical protein